MKGMCYDPGRSQCAKETDSVLRSQRIRSTLDSKRKEFTVCMLHPQYVVGLVDGEGSFTVYARNPTEAKQRKRRVLVEPRFFLKLQEEDKETLEELQMFFGCGKVYFQKDARRNHKQCYRYEVTKRSDLVEKIIPFFKRNPLRFQSKRDDFEIFCEIMELVLQGKHLTREGQEMIYRMKQQMH